MALSKRCAPLLTRTIATVWINAACVCSHIYKNYTDKLAYTFMFYLPDLMPAARELQADTYVLQEWQQVQGVRRVLLLNLMPQKPVTELDVARTLAATGISFQLIPIKFSGQTYKTTSAAHMEANYLTFEKVESYNFDRLIITGAPVEQYNFEEVRYWEYLCRLMDWALSHVDSTLYVCWGAQAGLYHHYGIPKYQLPFKCFGVFTQQVLKPDSPFMRGLAPTFPMPTSRHTEVQLPDIKCCRDAGLQLLAVSNESGVGVVASADGKQLFIVGHLEYEPMTLDCEYHRDLERSLPIQAPVHYYAADGSVPFVWQQSAIQFYANWLTV